MVAKIYLLVGACSAVLLLTLLHLLASLGTKQQEIVVSRGKILELLRPDPNTGKVHTLLTVEVFGVIRSLMAFRLTGGTKDYIVVGSDSGRIVILEYQPSKNVFEKIHQETFGKSGCRRIVPGQYLAVDPKGRAVMISKSVCRLLFSLFFFFFPVLGIFVLERVSARYNGKCFFSGSLLGYETCQGECRHSEWFLHADGIAQIISNIGPEQFGKRPARLAVRRALKCDVWERSWDCRRPWCSVVSQLPQPEMMLRIHVSSLRCIVETTRCVSDQASQVEKHLGDFSIRFTMRCLSYLVCELSRFAKASFVRCCFPAR